MLAQRAVGYRVEGPARDAPGLVPMAGKARLTAFYHLTGGPAGERQEQHSLRRDAAGDDVRHPPGQRGGLAGARAREDAQGAALELGDCALFLIETRQQIRHAFESSPRVRHWRHLDTRGG